jgi:uncharacterized protein (DUF1778 family)
MDLRMEASHRAAYKEAVRLKGQSLSQRSLANLDAAAARDIEEACVMRMAAEEFVRFCVMLDQPMPSSSPRPRGVGAGMGEVP